MIFLASDRSSPACPSSLASIQQSLPCGRFADDEAVEPGQDQIRRLPILLRSAGHDQVADRHAARSVAVQSAREYLAAVGLDRVEQRAAVDPTQSGKELQRRDGRGGAARGLRNGAPGGRHATSSAASAANLSRSGTYRCCSGARFRSVVRMRLASPDRRISSSPSTCSPLHDRRLQLLGAERHRRGLPKQLALGRRQQIDAAEVARELDYEVVEPPDRSERRPALRRRLARPARAFGGALVGSGDGFVHHVGVSYSVAHSGPSFTSSIPIARLIVKLSHKQLNLIHK